MQLKLDCLSCTKTCTVNWIWNSQEEQFKHPCYLICRLSLWLSIFFSFFYSTNLENGVLQINTNTNGTSDTRSKVDEVSLSVIMFTYCQIACIMSRSTNQVSATYMPTHPHIHNYRYIRMTPIILWLYIGNS